MVEKFVHSHQVTTYEQIAERAGRVRALLARLGIEFHRDSAFSKMLREAEKLDADWKAKRSGSIRNLVNAATAQRILEAMLGSELDPGSVECFKRIAKSEMDLSFREKSKGKDVLWELDLAAAMKQKGLSVQLVDPPDIVLDIRGTGYPIACKKTYTEAGAESQVRRGAQQLDKFGVPGLVALNLDDLVPEDSILESKTSEGASEYLDAFNKTFIEKNRQKFERFIAAGRCDGILVSTTTISDLADASTRFNIITETTLWTLANIKSATSDRLAYLANAMGARTPFFVL